ncbi:hypothetical protein BP6252_00517 [Coleophoma cylindrospora]|uniref:Zn(2)-C6 fungal-type domain-containing protein n=1 Tax=Coleophoma cylindrospora TaxID=1849047 RepID=A0A3D8SQA0_9HELO|nr:hypothetical protein BP6252_00517 [Coleophoma cylindrospora]
MEPAETNQEYHTPDIRRTRQRVKLACEPCKERKKRCDGKLPCETCTRFIYECHYRPHRRKKAEKPSPASDTERVAAAAPEGAGLANRVSHEHGSENGENVDEQTTRKKANSSTGFARLLSKKLNPGHVQEPQLLAWNLGARDGQTALQFSITRIISLPQMQKLARSYFETIHQAFAFLNRDAVESKIVQRWAVTEKSDPQDPLLCGVAALGSLFSGGSRDPVEHSLIECAKNYLENESVLGCPSYDQVAGWTLRALYLRSTSVPHVAWITTCTMMHTIEAAETGPGNDILSEVATDRYSNQRLFWAARLLNTWVSDEYGRSKVHVKSRYETVPASRPGDFSTDLLHLYIISESLNPDHTRTAPELEKGISDVVAFKTRPDSIVLSQTNLSFALYRRLRFVATSISPGINESIVAQGVAGLDAVQRMVSRRQPWWHVANVPFQFICLLLVMDTPESLAQIGYATRTLEAVAQCFPNSSVTDALLAARTLIQLSQKRKMEDVFLMDQVLKTGKASVPMNSPVKTVAPVMAGMDENPDLLTNWSLDSGLDGIDFNDSDWDSIMGTDISLFQGGSKVLQPGNGGGVQI